MTEVADPGALNAFLHRFLDDRERGAVQGLAAYQAMFPGCDAALAAEYAALTATATAGASDRPELETIGPYRLLERLGRGSFGLVYRAQDTRLGRTVALKVLAESALATDAERQRLEREASIAARLDHPGIATVYEVARHGIWTCIAMRFVPGESLAALLQRSPGGVLPADAALALIADAARALHVAHCAGVVHRDVKPGNLMVTPAGAPVVVDFGLARDATGSAGSLGASAAWVGSPGYMAPEQIDPRLGPVDARADVWALGVTLHECLAGRRPFDAPTQARLFDAVLHAAPPPVRVPGLNARDLRLVLGTAMAKEPTRRYQSAAALADELERLRRGAPVQARPLGAAARLLRWTRRHPAVAGLLAAVLLTLVAGVAVAAALWVRAEGNLRDWERLADGRRLVQLQQAADQELLTVGAEQVPGIAAWLATAGELLARRSDHERALAALRARARPWSASTAALEQQRDAELQRTLAATRERLAFLRQRLTALDTEPWPADRLPALRAGLQQRLTWLERMQANQAAALDERLSYEFDDLRDQLQHDEITALVLGLRRLGGEPGPRTTTVAHMTARLEACRTLWQRTVGDHLAAWQAAGDRVARHPRYRGMDLAPQPGLIPLGPDPDSTLEEFAAPETGVVPVRGADGRFRVAAETALVFVLIPPGRFHMGAQSGDPAAPGFDPLAVLDEAPVRELEVRPFFLAKHEMTQGQWLRLTDDNPATQTQGARDGDLVVDFDHPVETVSWSDCVETLRRSGWWLPTEAQWEYACRAGGEGSWQCPEAELPAWANLADRRFHATDPHGSPFLDVDDGRSLHAPVGSYRPNAFGLHDMMGNVAEWCFDQYLPYDPERTTAAAAPQVLWMQERVFRGGSFASAASLLRSAARQRYEGTVRTYVVGVRPMRALAGG